MLTASFLLSLPLNSALANTQTETAAIEKRLQEIIPGLQNPKIDATPVKGLYQVLLGMEVVYMSADGQFLMQGDLIDLKNKVNLTREVTLKERRDALATIPEASMLIYPAEAKASKKATITVFTDIQCPYCKKLHLEIPELNKAGVTVRYLAYPRAGIGSESYQEAVAVWCADKPVEAMDLAMKGQKVATKTCENPVEQHMQYAQAFQVNGTPNILLEDGTLIPGYVPAAKLLEEIFAKGEK
ncbi:MAG: DsbC family protein [Thiotrichales bacterium]|nr:DsbC family protein [Thiotrichales bacterium]